MTIKDGKYYCNDCKKEISKGTGFSFPDKTYQLHQECYYNKMTNYASISTDRLKIQAKENIKNAKDMVKEYNG